MGSYFVSWCHISYVTNWITFHGLIRFDTILENPKINFKTSEKRVQVPSPVLAAIHSRRFPEWASLARQVAVYSPRLENSDKLA